jgi:hypothetical protein
MASSINFIDRNLKYNTQRRKAVMKNDMYPDFSDIATYELCLS